MKNQLGNKCMCYHCCAPFYDLNKTPITCPKCEKEHKPDSKSMFFKNGGAKLKKPKKKPIPVVMPDPDVADNSNDFPQADEFLEDLSDFVDTGDDDESMVGFTG